MSRERRAPTNTASASRLGRWILGALAVTFALCVLAFVAGALMQKTHTGPYALGRSAVPGVR